MVAAGGSVYAVGKIADIFAHRGITKHYAAGGLDKLVDATKQAVADAMDNTIVFTNFVDFDSSYGHRRDIQAMVRHWNISTADCRKLPLCCIRTICC